MAIVKCNLFPSSMRSNRLLLLTCLFTLLLSRNGANAKKPIFKDANGHHDKPINLAEMLKFHETAEDEIGTMDNRIVGGGPAPVDLYPWFTSLVYDLNGSIYLRGCGAMLVAPEFVLTAAHCMPFPAGTTPAVMIGAVCPFQADNCGQPIQVVYVESVIVFPEYENLRNDFTLLKLDRRANADPVAMDQGQYVTNYSNIKRNLWGIGFGALYYQGPSPSELHHVELAYVDPVSCAEDYFITGHMMCAADPGQDTCQGDSGGPLYDADNNVVVGITSFGNGCADPNYAGVYAKVSSRWNWIKSTICNNHSDPKPDFCSPCGAGEIDLSISVSTDEYPGENTWTLQSPITNSLVQTFTDELETYNSKYCLDESACYTFTITDTFGDGLTSRGSFSVLVDNDFVLSNPGTDSWDSLQVQFGQCDPGATPSPSASPSTAEISTLPTVAPTSNPSAQPSNQPSNQSINEPSSSPTSFVSSSNCVDTIFRFRLRKNGRNISRGCDWVANRDTVNRCNLDGVSSMCPFTCGACDGSCFNGMNRFRLPWKGRMVTRDCVWVNNKQTIQRCNVPGVSDTCRLACGAC